MKIIEFESLSSTNDYIKSHIQEGDMIVTAKYQTAGRGSKNRQFNSGMGGLYLSKLTCYENFSASRVFEIMLNTSVAVCRTMEDFGLRPTVKWPNDVYINGKKVCGILIENTFSGEFITRSVVGIGINVNNNLPRELKDIAVTMSGVRGKPLDLNAVKKRLIIHLQENFSVEEYKKYIFFFNRKIFLLQSDVTYEVTALDVDEKGRLIVDDNGKIRTVTAGEVSLRFIN